MRSELRRCLVCRCINHRHLLFRLQKIAKEPVYVRSQAFSGPSLYLCQHKSCIEKMQKKRLLQKRWGEIPDVSLRELCHRLQQALSSEQCG